MVTQLGQAGVQITDEMIEAGEKALIARWGAYLEDQPDQPSEIARTVLEAGLLAANGQDH